MRALSTLLADSFYGNIRPDIITRLYEYAQVRHPIGDFLRAVLCNDLFEACGRADSDNARSLTRIVAFVYNELPSESHGSPERVAGWLKKGGLRGEAAA